MASLQKNLGYWQGLALYLAAVLGTGILVVPQFAWQEAGASSLIAWAILGLLGLALAWTFAMAGSKAPNAGGIQSMIEQVFGRRAGMLSRWLIFFSLPAGGVAASHIFADHIAAAFQLSTQTVPWIAWGSWVAVGAANYFGIRISANAQLAMSAILVLMLSLLILIGLPFIRLDHFEPFAPTGLGGIGKSAVIIFWSFLGWEAIAHLAEEFKNPERDMLRAAVTAGIVVGFFYFAVAFVLIGLGALTSDHAGGAPLVLLAERFAGPGGRLFSGVLAGIICLGTMNAYMAGISRLGYAMARDGDLPYFLAKLDAKNGTPKRAIVLLFSLNSLALLAKAGLDLPMRAFFLIPNIAFLFLYTLGCLSVTRLLRGHRGAVATAYGAAFVSAVMIPFASGVLWYPTLVIIAALFYYTAVGKRRAWKQRRS